MRYGYATDGRALRMCGDCGSMVGDNLRHDQFHAEMDATNVLTVATAMNLLGTVNTLIEAGIDIEVDDGQEAT
jgi:hypothetical protein